LLSAGLLIIFISGCDRHARHKVLTFFFTGVPPLEEEKKLLEEEKKAAVPAEYTEKKKRKPFQMTTQFSHGPFASGKCNQCHEISQTASFRSVGKKEEEPGQKAKPDISQGRLVVPLNKLCVQCHKTKSRESAYKEGLWLHGPVSDGHCTLCHGAHSGPNLYLLFKKADELCLQCHAEGLVFSRAAHKDRGDCISCHNAHLGKDSRLLKTDFNEIW